MQNMIDANCLAALESGAVLLTPDPFLAQYLQEGYAAEKIVSSEKSWVAPAILPIDAWIASLWEIIKDKIDNPPLLLNAEQEQLLWEKIIAGAAESSNILQLHATASCARSAYQLIKAWQIDLQHPNFDQLIDYKKARDWYQAFENELAKQHWVCAAQLGELIVAFLSTQDRSNSDFATDIFYIGLNNLTPQTEAILNYFQATEIQSPTTPTTNCDRLAFENADAEIIAMANWAKSCSKKQLNLRIACVISNPQQQRIEQIFSIVFAEENRIAASTEHLPFAINIKQKLTSHPIIQFAFTLLHLQNASLTIDNISALLLSPFLIGAESEKNSRARLDFLLRDTNIYRLNLKKVCTNATPQSKWFEQFCPLLFTQLQLFYQRLAQSSITTAHEWMQFFSELLSILGWPGERALNKVEQQVLENWVTLLTTMQSLDIFNEAMPFAAALNKLEQAADRATFKCANSNQQLQILSLREAANTPFDAIWIAGMHELNWPAAASPHPLIPKSIQQQLNLPRSSPASELAFCKKTLEILLSNTPLVHCSYAKQVDGVMLNPSPLINHIQSKSLAELALPVFEIPAEIIFKTRQIESISDIQAPAVTETMTSGGTGILKNQAACPFKAFAEHRLHARPLAASTPGLNASERGTLVHAALEKIWLQLQNQANLLAMPEPALKNLIVKIIDQTFKTKKELSTRYLALEKQRLQQLIFNWLTLEKTRDDFSVFACEASMQVNYQQLNFNMRIDRIDLLGNGKQLIIDYKTGQQQDASDWFGERPDEPQLPLYALTNTNDICSIAFAQVAPSNQRFKGVAANDVGIPGIKLLSTHKAALDITWGEQIIIWQQHFQQLAIEFMQGHANVTPKDTANNCQYCALKAFCRIYEYT